MSFSYNRIVRVPLHIPRARHEDFAEFLFQLQQNCSDTIARPSRPTCRFHRVSLSAATESFGYHCTSRAPDMQISQSFSFSCNRIVRVPLSRHTTVTISNAAILSWATITLISVAESGWRKPRGEPPGLYSSRHPG